MYYTVYKTTCLVNGKTYIGCCTTEDLNNPSLGSAKALLEDIRAYGRISFLKEMLFVFDNPTDMYSKRKEIQDVGPNSYNVLYGFAKSPEYAKELSQRGTVALQKRFEDPKFMEEHKRHSRENALNQTTEQRKRFLEAALENSGKGLEKARSKEAVEKRKLTQQRIKFNQGENNSQFGKKWVHNEQEERSVPPHKLLEVLSQGFVLGRKTRPVPPLHVREKRLLEKLSRVESRKCSYCLSEFEVSKTSDKKFCSRRCVGKSPEVRAKLSAKMVDAVINGKIGDLSIRCSFPFKGYEIRCDSKLEYACLDYVVKNLNPLEIKRCGIHIPYFFLGEEKRFNPDFEVLTTEGVYIVECKGTCPNRQRNIKWSNYSEKIPLKMEALEGYCASNGFKPLWFEMKMHKKFYYSLDF